MDASPNSSVMFSSIFSTAPPVDPTAPNFFPVSSQPGELFGELEPKDTEWLCPGGFATETQTFYNALDNGMLVMVQIIHSAIGVWYPSIQLNCKLYDPKTEERTWKTVNITNWVTGPPGLDKRSAKGDQFSFTHKSTPGSDFPEKYILKGDFSTDFQVSLEISRPANASGWKVGKGPEGGYSYFGPDKNNAEGYAIHRFWPHTIASGLIIHNGQAIMATGPGIFIHAILGMRPNLLASRWDFTSFQSTAHGGVSAIQMAFTTLDTHGLKGAGSGGVTVNVGSVVLGGKLVAVIAEAQSPDEAQEEKAEIMSRAVHLKPELDEETSYMVPTGILYTWASPTIQDKSVVAATLQLDLGKPSDPVGLVEKVDVLAEIPYVLKAVVNYVAQTKPYIYQYLQNAKLLVNGTSELIPGLSDGLEVAGVAYSEASFIS